MLLQYFKPNLIYKKKYDTSYYIERRKKRNLIKGTSLKFFSVGDVIEFVYVYKSLPLIFRGLCIAVRRKLFIRPDVTVILRNVIMKVCIEVTASYYYNRLYKLKFLDFKRKIFFFNRNKIYYIRKLLDKESQIDKDVY